MRIVGGSHRGRRLAAPKGRETRPTSDRAREGVFNILAHSQDADFEDLFVIDLFAGSGAMGIEALSRGAAEALFVENSRAARAVIDENVNTLGLRDQTAVEAWDATRLPVRRDRYPPAGLVFLDPPYGKGLIPPALNSLISGAWLAETATIVAETGSEEDLAFPPAFSQMSERAYGDAFFRFLTLA
ncbi:MAG: 16S rRNA (guanine(966)-N(2))-methyltransferase RsmD [Rhodospirillaceae bacterium]